MSRKVIIMLVSVFLIIGIGGGGYVGLFMFTNIGDSLLGTQSDATIESAPEEPKFYYQLPVLTIPIYDNSLYIEDYLFRLSVQIPDNSYTTQFDDYRGRLLDASRFVMLQYLDNHPKTEPLNGPTLRARMLQQFTQLFGKEVVLGVRIDSAWRRPVSDID